MASAANAARDLSKRQALRPAYAGPFFYGDRRTPVRRRLRRSAGTGGFSQGLCFSDRMVHRKAQQCRLRLNKAYSLLNIDYIIIMDPISPRRSPRGTKRAADAAPDPEYVKLLANFGQKGARKYMTPVRYNGKAWHAKCNFCEPEFEQKKHRAEAHLDPNLNW